MTGPEQGMGDVGNGKGLEEEHAVRDWWLQLPIIGGYTSTTRTKTE